MWLLNLVYLFATCCPVFCSQIFLVACPHCVVHISDASMVSCLPLCYLRHGYGCSRVHRFAKDIVFVTICWLVGLSAGLLKTLWKKFRDIFLFGQGTNWDLSGDMVVNWDPTVWFHFVSWRCPACMQWGKPLWEIPRACIVSLGRVLHSVVGCRPQ